jgi:hypothetical protein
MKALVLAALAALVLATCAGPASTGGPSASASTVSTPAAAAARVVEVEPGLVGIGQKDPNLIGGCCFWEAAETPAGFEVVFEVGWGDCPAGCIEKHRWTYAVGRDGSVALVAEDGDPVPPGVPAPSGGDNTGGGAGILPGGTGIEGTVSAGPTCPVVSVNDPTCDDRPIAGATILVLDASGREVARLHTDQAGHYAVTLPAGPYVVEPQPAEGFLRTAEQVPVTVVDGYVTVDLAYDTGIR